MRKRIKRPEIKITEIKDDIGNHKVITQKGKVKVKILKEPSEKYIEKVKKNIERQKEIKNNDIEIMKKEKLINDRMREIAIRELKSEGKI